MNLLLSTVLKIMITFVFLHWLARSTRPLLSVFGLNETNVEKHFPSSVYNDFYNLYVLLVNSLKTGGSKMILKDSLVVCKFKDNPSPDSYYI